MKKSRVLERPTEVTDPASSFLCRLCEKPSKQTGYIKSAVCSDCLQEWPEAARKVMLIEYKGGCCQACGYSKCIAALDFHHTDPLDKEFNIGSHIMKPLDTIKSEVRKCVLLCSRCHREYHYATTTYRRTGKTDPIVKQVKDAHRNWLLADRPLLEVK